jgi:CBS domain-containing protein
MFAIYDVKGRSFRDTLENLQKVRKAQPPRRVSPHLQDQDQGEEHRPAPGKNYSVSAQAHQAYRQKLHISERESVIHAHQIMSHPIETMQMTMDIVSAWKRFSKMRYHQLPVLDMRHQIVGMLTERDLLQFLIVEDNQIKSQSNKIVADAMSEGVITADPVTDVRRIAKVMLDYRQSAVPITDEHDTLCGLVSRSDILQAAAVDPPLSLWT